MKYAIMGVEGPHDQVFTKKLLKLLGFKEFNGSKLELDRFWHKFIPKYPKNETAKLYERLAMPSIVFNESISVAIYQGEGSKLKQNLEDILCNNLEYQTDLAAFGIVADADKKQPVSVAEEYGKCFQNYFKNFPEKPGIVDTNKPRTGIYVLPDNVSEGVLDTLLCRCGEVAYPEYMKKANAYISEFSEEERKKLKWKPFDLDKVLVAKVVSVLKPGKTNTVSVADNDWVSETTLGEVSLLANFQSFLRQLLEVI